MTSEHIPPKRARRKKRETPAERRLRILDAKGHHCTYCGTSLRYTTRLCPDTGWDLVVGEYPQIDHDLPRCRGGTEEDSNLVPSCAFCNSQKGGKTGDEYRAWKAARI